MQNLTKSADSANGKSKQSKSTSNNTENISETKRNLSSKIKSDLYCKNECKAKLRFLVSKDESSEYRLASEELKDIFHCHCPKCMQSEKKKPQFLITKT